jgi:hypothetical protein
MQHSENINELATALSKAQCEMSAAKMDSSNPFFKSKYADLASIWDAARPALGKYSLCVMQSMELVGEKTVLVTTLVHSSGQWMKSTLPLSPGKPGMQEMGSAITYARRYALAALIGIVCDSEDDDGEKAMNGIRQPSKAALHPFKSVEKTVNVSETPKISDTQYTELVEKCKLIDDAAKDNMKKYVAKTNISNWKEMPIAVWSVCMQMAENNIKMNEVKT